VRQSEQTQYYVQKNYQENGMGRHCWSGTHRPSNACSHPSQNPEKDKKSQSNLAKF